MEKALQEPNPWEKQFSNNPRYRELAQKAAEGKATPEETAELVALRQFPDNPRGRELAQKAAEGKATPEETAELVALRSSTRDRISNL